MVFLKMVNLFLDVCNPHPGGDRMTTPQDFEDRITKTLLYLDTILPNGSFVFFTGLFEVLLF